MFCWNSGLLKAPNVHFHFSVTFCLCFKKSLRAKPFVPFPLQIHFHADQTHFHVKRFLQRLVLKQRLKVTRKWPIKGLRIFIFPTVNLKTKWRQALVALGGTMSKLSKNQQSVRLLQKPLLAIISF